jgi:hypothetical protein
MLNRVFSLKKVAAAVAFIIVTVSCSFASEMSLDCFFDFTIL